MSPVQPRALASKMLSRTRDRLAADEAARHATLTAIQDALPAIAAELALGRVWLIGSVAWGHFGVRSDVDLVVERGEDAFSRIELEDRVGRLVHKVVDVLPLSQLSESFRRRVMAEGLRVA